MRYWLSDLATWMSKAFVCLLFSFLVFNLLNCSLFHLEEISILPPMHIPEKAQLPGRLGWHSSWCRCHSAAWSPMGGAMCWHFPTWSLSDPRLLSCLTASSLKCGLGISLACKTEAKSVNKNVVVSLTNEIQAFNCWEICGLPAVFSAFVRSMCNSTSLSLSPSDHAAAACAYCCVSSCHFVVAFGFDCFEVVLFEVSTVHQRLEMHSAHSERARSSTVIKNVQETGRSLHNHAVLPRQLSSDTQGLIHKT